MDLYKLGTDPLDPYFNLYQPARVVEGWTSLIWTERYTEAGDFQLKTPLIDETLSVIPDGSLVCINESREIMRVDSHSLAENEEGVMEATITGRSFETFLEERNIESDVGLPYPMLQEYKVQTAIGVLIHNVIGNFSTIDKTGGPNANSEDRFLGHDVSIFDNIIPTKPASTEDPPDISDLQSTQEWFLESGDAYTTVLDWLRVGELGIRTTRPRNSYTNVLAVSFTGVPTTTPFIKINTVVWDIYNGRIRTFDQAEAFGNTPVIFRHDAGHIRTPTYLLSRKGYKNICRVVSSEGEVLTWDGDDGWTHPGGGGGFVPDPSGQPVGINRYEMTLDLGTIDSGTLRPETYMRQKGKAALKKHNRQILIDGAISASAPYSYGPDGDYYLGDYVTTIGQFGVNETMQVNEYIRSQDSNGYQGYPTLIRADLDGTATVGGIVVGPGPGGGHG